MFNYKWGPDMSVGVQILDEQHQQLVDTITKLDQSITDKKENTELLSIFDRLNEYINQHFATEEKYFKEFKYSQAEEHCSAHSYFKGYINGLKLKIDQGALSVSLDLLNFLHIWLVGHVLIMDKQYVSCFKQHGLK